MNISKAHGQLTPDLNRRIKSNYIHKTSTAGLIQPHSSTSKESQYTISCPIKIKNSVRHYHYYRKCMPPSSRGSSQKGSTCKFSNSSRTLKNQSMQKATSQKTVIKEKPLDPLKSFYDILNDKVRETQINSEEQKTSVKEDRENLVPFPRSNVIRDHIIALKRKKELEKKFYLNRNEKYGKYDVDDVEAKPLKQDRLNVSHKSLSLTSDSKKVATNKMVQSLISKQEKTLKSLITKKEKSKTKSKSTVEDYFQIEKVTKQADKKKEVKSVEAAIQESPVSKALRKPTLKTSTSLELQPQIYCRMGVMPKRSLPIEPCKNVFENEKNESKTQILVKQVQNKAREVINENLNTSKEKEGLLGSIKGFMNVIKDSSNKAT